MYQLLTDAEDNEPEHILWLFNKDNCIHKEFIIDWNLLLEKVFSLNWFDVVNITEATVFGWNGPYEDIWVERVEVVVNVFG